MSQINLSISTTESIESLALKLESISNVNRIDNHTFGTLTIDGFVTKSCKQIKTRFEGGERNLRTNIFKKNFHDATRFLIEKTSDA